MATVIAMRLDDGRVVDEHGEIWSMNPRHPLELESFAACPKCKQDVAVARSVLGGQMWLDSDGSQHRCRPRITEVRAWPPRSRR